MRFNSYNKKPPTTGFTLIEVVVAVGIITVLAAITLAAVSSSREQADDRAIRQQLGVMRLEAERVFRDNRSPDQVCVGISNAGLDADLPDGTVFKCVDGPSGYALEAELSTGEFYCTDAFGRTHTNSATAVIDAGDSCDPSEDCDCRYTPPGS